VHYFLEKQVGVYWFTPDKPTIPRRKTLEVQVDGQWQQPRFAYREVFFRLADNPLFAARDRLNGRFGHPLSLPFPASLGPRLEIRKLNIFELVPPEVWRDSNPNFFAGGQLRFANADVQRAAKQRLREYLAQWQEPPTYILIEHADRETYFSGGKDGRLIERY